MSQSELKELEVKILDIDIAAVKAKLEKIGAKYKGEQLQRLFVYDVPSIRSTYLNLLDDIRRCKDNKKEKVIVKKIKSILFDIENLLNDEENQLVKQIFDNKNPSEFLNNRSTLSENVKKILFDDSFIKIVSKYDINPNKWVRLRQSGDKCTLTIKHILTKEDLEYDIDKLNEYETSVGNIEMANLILEQLNVVARGYQEKYRISYEFNGVDIELDKWPLIPPYIEIEGKSVEKIYDTVQKLGYRKDEAKIMNTSEVYKIYGLNIYDYEELKLTAKDKEMLESYKNSRKKAEENVLDKFTL